MKFSSNFLILLLALIIIIPACKKEKSTRVKDTFSSERSLFVEYVSSHTSGFVSSQSEIRLKLAKPVPDVQPGAELDMSVFSFSPSIEGKAFWEDSRTIVFKPDSPLEGGQQYKVRFSLGKLIEIPSDKDEFKFTFECIPQNYEVTVEGLSLYDATDLTKMKIVGYLQTSDVTTNEDVEKIISATQDGNDLQISYEHGIGAHRHKFTVENVVRKDEAGEVNIAWSGTPIDVEKSGDMKVDIPSLGDYKVTSAKLIRGAESYISVLFSDPLDENQNLRGIVSFSEGRNPRVVADLNELKIYPTSTLSGRIEVEISKFIKNVAGFTLDEDYTTTITISTLKPQVRIAANSGVIMPSSEGLIVPFEAVSLSAVDLTIVKVFENNVVQYLQSNDFGQGEDWELRPVARPVVRKTIPLAPAGATDLGSWNRFTIDLANYVDVEPGAFYQVRLNFRMSHSLFGCTNTDAGELSFHDDLEFEESTDWDNTYDSYYYYDWENRDNPCHKAYYTSRNIVKKIVFASDIGIIAKASAGGSVHVYTTDLLTTEPVSGTDIQVYDYQQQLIGTGSTDGEGKAEIEVSGSPFVLIARKDNEAGYLKVNDGSALSVSNFNVSGSTVQRGIKGYVYGERGVWRPADTLHLAFMLEDVKDRLPEGHPVILEVYNPLGQLHSRNVQTSSVKDLYTFKVLTDKDDPTGNWQARVKVGGAQFTKQLKVETVKPNRLKMELTFDKDMLYATDGTQNADLNIRWLHGATARNLRATYEVLLVPKKTTFKNYEPYVFDDPRKTFDVDVQEVFDNRVDNEGKARLSFRLESGRSAPGMLTAIFRGKAFEEGGDFSIDRTTTTYVPYRHFVGMNLQVNDRWGRVTAETDHNVDIVTLDARGNPVDRRVNIEIFEIRWRWWWDNSWESSSSYNSRNYTELKKEGTLTTQNGKGVYKLNLPRDWGRYYMKVTDAVSGHSTGKVFYLTYPGWARQVRGQLGGVTMLDFSVSDEKVNVGDNVALTFPSSDGGRALISLETGSKVVSTSWVETEQGNTTVNFTATEEMAPNIYANITLLQPHSETGNDLPIRMYGIQPIEVVDPATVLTPEISMPDKLGPGEKFTVKVKEKDGKPMAYTVAIVEDGLLDLTKFRTPDPWSTFYAKEALGIKTWDVFDDVMGTYGGQIERLLALGGDDEVAGPDENEANRFKPVIMYKGPYFLDNGDEAEHNFTMPEYIGSVRAMVVAGHDGRYGKSDKTVPVKQPLMILATLPRVAGPSEDIALPVNVFAMEDNIRNVEVKVEATGNLKLAGPDSRKLSFTGTGDKVEYFQLKATDDLGVGKVMVTATSGNLTAKYDVELQIRPSNPPMVQVEETILSSGDTWSANYQPLGIRGTNEASVELSSLPPLNLEQRLRYLIRYPHGCIEQTTSSVFAQLYLDDIMELTEERSTEVERNINAAIERLRQFQLPSGGFAYWPGSSESNFWGTNYAGHFLIEAQENGYLVPEDIITKWTNYQLNEANQWNAGNFRDYMIQAYRLYTLAAAGRPALGAMSRLSESTRISKRAKWTLASAYAIAGYDKAANDLVDGLNTDLENYRELGGSYGSTQRDQAMILEALVHLNRETDAFEMVRKIAEHLGNNNRWMSTQTTAYCLIGIAEFAKKFPPGEGVSVGVSVAGNDFRVDGEKYLSQVTLIEPDDPASIEVSNNGNSPIFVKVIRMGVPIEGEEEAAESNIRLQVNYKRMDGTTLDVNNISQGTDFVAEVSILNPGLRGDYEEIAVTQIFPSGWEIINTRLDDVDQFYSEDIPEYKDIRDDRVMTYFDLRANERKTFVVLLNASYQGRYYLPAVQVEAMYDNSIAANTAGRWVKVNSDD